MYTCTLIFTLLIQVPSGVGAVLHWQEHSKQLRVRVVQRNGTNQKNGSVLHLKNGSSSTAASGSFASSDSLVIYNVSEDGQRRIVPTVQKYNFSMREVEDLNYSRSHGLIGVSTVRGCDPATTIFDLGFYDGADSGGYLQSGYCVIAVEADPDLVKESLRNFAVWIAAGQLKVVNVAIAPSGDPTTWTTFYRSRCTKEWNSFFTTIGCRGCEPPHTVQPPPSSTCDAVPITAVQCVELFRQFGAPYYMKLDIEGSESGCFDAIQTLGPSAPLPKFVSAEITEVAYLDTLYSLGFVGFKLVRQDRLHTGTGSTSGAWGNNALDCRLGTSWRTYGEVRQEMLTVLSKGFDAADPCPGGIMPIRGNTSMKDFSAYMWYDVHATRSPGGA